jgi:hypothetical protein
MKPFKPKVNVHQGPEAKIHADLEKYLRAREWFVVSTHGNQFQFGLPDIFATHSKFGARWIEVKHGHAFSFTSAQMDMFPKFGAHGSGIWVLCEATDREYERLFKAANIYEYMMCYTSGCRDIYKWRGGNFK